MSDINTNATVVLNVNGKEAAETLAKLKQRAADYKDAIAKAAKAGDNVGLKKLRKELNDTNRELRAVQSATQSVDAVMRRLDKATPRELRQTLSVLNRQMNDIERGSRAWEIHAEKIRSVKKELAEVNQSIDSFTEGGLTKWLSKWQTSIVMFVEKIFSMLPETIAGAVEAYADLDSAMANTQKFTGMTRDEVESLNEEFKKMDTRTSVEGLNELAQSAGRLGKKSVDDVMGFVRAGDIIGVAMDELGTDAPEIISKLAGIFNLEDEMGTEKAILSVGSAINSLSQNYAAASPSLVDFSSRMGATASQTNMAMHEMLAFGTLLDANGVSIEKSATALQGVISKMYAAPATFAQKASLDVNAFTEALQRSSTEGVMMFVDALSQMNQMELNATLADLGISGAGVTQTFQTLAGKSADLKTIMTESAEAFADATSATEEFNVQNNTLQARLDKSKKEMYGLVAELGKQLLPMVESGISFGKSAVKVLGELLRWVGENKGALAAFTVSIIAYTVAVKAAVIWQRTATVATSAWAIATKVAAVATAFFTGNLHKAKIEFKLFSLLIKANPIWLLVSAITAVSGALLLLTKRTNVASEAQKTLNNIRNKAKEDLTQQKNNIDLLVAAAQNELLSLDERRKAINRLNEIVPDYNAQLDETTGKYRANDKALKDYMETLIRSYELEGAKTELESLGREKARLKAQKEDVNATIAITETLTPEQTATAPRASGGAVAPAAFNTAIGARGDLQAAKNTLRDIDRQLSVIEAKEASIKNAYGLDLQRSAIETAESSIVIAGEKCPKCGKTPCVCREEPTGETSERFATEKAWREQMDLENKLAWRRGLKDYEEYLTDKENIEEQYYIRVLERKELTDAERLQMETEQADVLAKQNERAHNRDVEMVENAYREQMQATKQAYIDGTTNAEEFKNKTEEIELERLRALMLLTERGSKERMNAEQRYMDARVADMERRKAKEKKDTEEHEREITEIRRKYFGLTAKEQAEVEKNAFEALEEAYKWQLTAAGDADAIAKIEEQYKKAREALEREFADPSWFDRVKGRIGTSPFDGLIEMLLPEDINEDLKNTIMNFASQAYSIYGSITEMMVAETEIQIAAIEKRYEKEISLAEGNSYKISKLEKQKEKEIAKAKADANRKQFAMQVIQATAQTAQNAIAAYGSALAVPAIGYILAPIAAAAAVAAGLLQIAVIKKQQQASEAQGYATGGFTPKGGKYEPAGIVHKGEWVASQELLASPVARPVIEALDYAQRTNTIGRLGSDNPAMPEIYGATGSNVVSGELSAALAAQAAAIAGYSQTIRRLNERLDEPFVTVNTVTGDAGIKRAQDEYEKLIDNKRPKYRKK